MGDIMKLTIDNIKEMNTSDIFSNVLPSINNVYKNYSYLNLSEEEYIKVVNEKIEKSKREYDGEVAYVSFIKKKIIIALMVKTKKVMKDNEKAYNIINGFINQTFDKIDNIDDIVKCFKKLDSFLEIVNFIPDTTLIMKLLNNNIKVLTIIKLLFTKYQEKIVLGDLDSIGDSNSLISFIDIYCIANNIEIKKEDDLSTKEDENLILSSSLMAYLLEIKKIPLLSFEEEKSLAKKRL